MIPRIQKEALIAKIKAHKLLLISGPRSAGKTTLIETIAAEQHWACNVIHCGDKNVRKALESSLSKLDQNAQIIVLHEAQYLSNLQDILEQALMNDQWPTLLACCSFQPKIDEMLLEALKIEGLEVTVYAPSFYESAQHFGLPEEERLLEERLIFGSYPDVLANLEQAEQTLRGLVQEVLSTHLGASDRINKKDKMMRVLQLLAFHIGDAVSYNDIAERAGVDNETVERYVELLEQAHVLIQLPSYHTGQRYELKKSHAIYFVDNGIRNALISNFNPTFLRNDMDVLWRNYLVSERVKWARMQGVEKAFFFWKTHTKQQMDFVEVANGELTAYKTDWEKRKKVKIPHAFTSAYPNAKTGILNRSTYWSFLTKKK